MIFNKIYGVLGGCVQLAFPNSEYLPAECLQLSLLASVPLDCPAKFLGPEVGARLRHRRTGTPFMAVPEAPVNEDDRAVLRENDVRFSGEAGSMQPEAKTSPVEKATKKNFGFCVLAPDLGHVPAAAFFRNPIRHASPSFI